MGPADAGRHHESHRQREEPQRQMSAHVPFLSYQVNTELLTKMPLQYRDEFTEFVEPKPGLMKPVLLMLYRAFTFWLHDTQRIDTDEAKDLLHDEGGNPLWTW